MHYIKATGAELEALLNKIMASVHDDDEGHVAMACLAIAIVYQFPEVKHDELEKLIKGTSEYIAIQVAELIEPIDLKDMN